jgi:serine protease DegQ
VGDIVLKIGDEAVHDSIGFLNQIAPLPPGQEVTLTIRRDGRTREMTVQVGQRPPIRKP